jgi:hypothetical protein
MITISDLSLAKQRALESACDGPISQRDIDDMARQPEPLPIPTRGDIIYYRASFMKHGRIILAVKASGRVPALFLTRRCALDFADYFRAAREYHHNRRLAREAAPRKSKAA